ncbi:MAG: hypothetical protein RR777_06510, partial [Christensenellaceae bacterium]
MHNGDVCCPDENCPDECLQERISRLWEHEEIGTVEEFAALRKAIDFNRTQVSDLMKNRDAGESKSYIKSFDVTKSDKWLAMSEYIEDEFVLLISPVLLNKKLSPDFEAMFGTADLSEKCAKLTEL